MIYLLLDTNIFVSILLDRKEYEYSIVDKNYGEIISYDKEKQNNYEIDYYNKMPKSLRDLEILCENEIVKLLVTEINELELTKANNEIRNSYNEEYKKLKDSIKSQELWNEVSIIKKDLEKIIDKHNEININNWEDGYNTLINFLNKNYNIKISLTPNIICNMYKKKISGEIKERQSNDFMFLNSAYNYLKNDYSLQEDKIFLLTKDKKDFFKSNRVKIDGIECYELNEGFKYNEIEVIGLNNIKSLYKYINCDTKIQDFIDEILSENIKNHNGEFFDVYEDSISKQEILKKFYELNKSIDSIEKKRVNLIKTIKEILSKCRKLESWNERSEMKLYGWLIGKKEQEIEVLKLSELLAINANLLEYYDIHLQLCEEE